MRSTNSAAGAAALVCALALVAWSGPASAQPDTTSTTPAADRTPKPGSIWAKDTPAAASTPEPRAFPVPISDMQIPNESISGAVDMHNKGEHGPAVKLGGFGTTVLHYNGVAITRVGPVPADANGNYEGYQQQQARLPRVPGAAMLIGDWVLQNDLVTFVISDLAHPNGNALTGGYIIDAFYNDRPADKLGQLHLYLGDKYPRMAKFQTITPVTEQTVAASTGPAVPGERPSQFPVRRPDAATIYVTGVDSQDPTINVMSAYTLRAGTNVLDLETTVAPRSAPLHDFPVGDVFAWGSAQQFVPGQGYETRRITTTPWVGGVAPGVAFGYFAEHGMEMTARQGSTWTNSNITTGSAEANSGTIVARRHFVIEHDLAGVQRAYFEEAGKKANVVSGAVMEAGEKGQRAEGVRINVSAAGSAVAAPGKAALITQAVTDAKGSFKLVLPDGSYQLTASDNVRSNVGSGSMSISLPADSQKEIKFEVSAPAVLNATVTDGEGGPAMPAKLRFFGREGTPDPDLGPVHETRAKNTIYLAKGSDRVALPAGKYTVSVSRGVEYDLELLNVDLQAGQQATLRVPLRRAFDRGTAVGADFHLHMKNSFDSAVSLEDRVISCAGEGLEVMVATDHNFVTDLEPIIASLKLTGVIRSIIGDEVTTREHFFGHFIGFPLFPNSSRLGNGATAYEKVTAQQLISAIVSAPNAMNGAVERKVVQVNHPRAGDIGYFDRVNLNPDDGTTTHPNWSSRFTAIEIFNGKRTDQFDEGLHDWMNLLNIGFVFTATSNSDSHKVFEAEPGFPRNFVMMHKEGSGADDPKRALMPQSAGGFRDAELVEAVNTNHAVVGTNGPFIRFSTKRGAPIGAMESDREGKVEFIVTVEGANFCQPNQVEFYANGKLLKTQPINETADHVKWKGTFEDEPTTDTFYVVVTRGSKSMFPVEDKYAEGRVELEPTPLAFTNPIWIDRNGDGKFSAKNAGKLQMMNADRSAQALKDLDALTSQSKVRGQFGGRRRGAAATPAGES